MNKRIEILTTLFLIVIVCIGFYRPVIAQEEQVLTFNNYLSEADSAKIPEAEELYNTAGELVASIDSINVKIETEQELLNATQNDDSRKKITANIEKYNTQIFEIQIKASGLFEKGSDLLFNMYKNHFNSIRSKILGNPKEQIKGRRTENEAMSLYEQAKKFRNESKSADSRAKIIELLEKAVKLESDAVGYQKKAYIIYRNWKVIDIAGLNPPSINDRLSIHSFYKIVFIDRMVLQLADKDYKINILKKVLSAEDFGKLSTADDFLKKADENMEESVKTETRAKELEKKSKAAQDDRFRRNAKKEADRLFEVAKQLKQQAETSYEAAHTLKFDTYQKNLELIKSQFRGTDNERDLAVLAEEIAKDYFTEAKSIRQNQQKDKSNKNDSGKEFDNAYNLEHMAIANLEKAVDIYINISSDALSGTVTTGDNSQFSDTVRPDFYMLQIAASKHELNQEEIVKIYQGEEEVIIEEDNGIYRYNVGFYLTIDDAEAARKKSGVDDAFIVGYKDGKRVFYIKPPPD